MHTIVDIPFLYVGISLLLMLIPLGVFYRFQVPLISTLAISIVRMVAQLSFIALYLEYIFTLNSIWLNLLWIFIMLIISSITSVKRSGLGYKQFVMPILVAITISLCIIDGFLFGFLLPATAKWQAQYVIPISGMIIGNAMNHNIVGLTNYFESLAKRPQLYYFILTNTGSFRFAQQPYVKSALKSALNPLIANMSVIGLISLPGMMTGQILGGSPPIIAIKYQVLIMVSIFCGCCLSLVLSIFISKRRTFDSQDRIVSELLVRAPLKKGHKKH